VSCYRSSDELDLVDLVDLLPNDDTDPVVMETKSMRSYNCRWADSVCLRLEVIELCLEAIAGA